MLSYYKLQAKFAFIAFIASIMASALFIISIILFLLNLAWPTLTVLVHIFAACGFLATNFFNALAKDAKLNSNARHVLILHNTAVILKKVRWCFRILA